MVKKIKEFWDKVFDDGLGCPAHLYPSNDTGMCQKGYCCSKCNSVCVKGVRKCPTQYSYCTVGGLSLEKIRVIYRSKKWSSYSDFAKEVEKYAERKRKRK